MHFMGTSKSKLKCKLQCELSRGEYSVKAHS
jgi:hypothetical protein